MLAAMKCSVNDVSRSGAGSAISHAMNYTTNLLVYSLDVQDYSSSVMVVGNWVLCSLQSLY